MNKETIEEAAERISLTSSVYESGQDDFFQGFIAGAKSDAAKEYWYEQFKKQYNDRN
jgi:hypothetical protein